jgi:hypothetical protein
MSYSRQKINISLIPAKTAAIPHNCRFKLASAAFVLVKSKFYPYSEKKRVQGRKPQLFTKEQNFETSTRACK